MQSIEGVSTNSIGSDNNRKIVIFLTDKKPEGLFEEPSSIPISEEFSNPQEDVTPGMNDTVSVFMNLGEGDENAESNVAVRSVAHEADACVSCDSASCSCVLDDVSVNGEENA